MSLKLILLGKSGVGKSSTGNSLLGNHAEHRFTTGNRSNAVTTSCCAKRNEVRGLTIVDTPGLFDTQTSLKERALEIQRSLSICKQPHAFLLVLKMDRIKEEDKFTIDLIRIIFGEAVFKHCIVIFTHGCCQSELCDKKSNRRLDPYDDEELKLFCSENSVLSDLAHLCSNRVMRVENNERQQCSIHTTNILTEQIKEKVKLISNNGKIAYSNRDLKIHRKVLEEHTTRYDNLIEELKALQERLTGCIERAREEEKRRQKLKDMAIGAVAVAVLGAAAATRATYGF